MQIDKSGMASSLRLRDLKKFEGNWEVLQVSVGSRDRW